MNRMDRTVPVQSHTVFSSTPNSVGGAWMPLDKSDKVEKQLTKKAVDETVTPTPLVSLSGVARNFKSGGRGINCKSRHKSGIFQSLESICSFVVKNA